MSSSSPVAVPLSAAAAQAAHRATDALLAIQHEPGFWWAELTADTTLESDYILLQLWLFPPDASGRWNPPSRRLIDKAVASILRRQLLDGGFSVYPQGPSDVSASVKAYFALKVAGIDPESSALTRCRQRILELGGLQAANSYVKINLSLFNLFPREHCPSVPPEMMLMPGQIIYEMSSWTRAIVIPLSIVQSLNSGRPVPAGFTVQELFKPGVSLDWKWEKDFFSWGNFFYRLDGWIKRWEKSGPKGIRKRALRAAEEWMVERMGHSDGLAAIYPAMQYTIMALDLLGYAADHPLRLEAQSQFDGLMVEHEDDFYFQPCFSVVWDTAIAAYALGEAECCPADVLRRASDWLLTKEVRRKGDWSVKRPHVEPSGWYFEFANEWYPDIDDTAMVLLALSQSEGSQPEAHRACVRRAVDWLIAMQSKDGGWAAFDVDNNWNALSSVPFADHNAMLDPTCPDITGRVIEALCRMGVELDHPAIQRGVEYLIRTQEQDGSWYGRWGVNYIYGTFLALRGLKAAGVSDRESYVLRAGEWLRSIQNSDGGWGESCASYDESTYVNAPSTPSQTAWAVLGLIAGGDPSSLSVEKGIEYLVDKQREDGTWDESLATGTGFPRVFYLTYHLYRDSFPLMALGAYLKSRGGH